MFYAGVFLSGAAGLIYQVVWHKYLAVLLGSHARATAVVLSVFLGGLGVGYKLFGGWSARRTGGLLRLFAFIELALGAYALAFPYLFRAAFLLAPKLDAGLGAGSIVTDLLLSLTLIGPPTVLMGGTLPLLTQGLSSDFKGASLVHARIYAFNTIGAACGALGCAYVLIHLLGLTVTMRVGALLNILVAGAVLRYTRPSAKQKTAPAAAPFAGGRQLSPSQLAIILIGLLSGFYVLTLETLLIRLMGLAAGSSSLHFSLIVSIFILGLGLTPLFAKRIAGYTPGHLFFNQTAVTVLLLIVYISGEAWPYAAHLLRIPFRSQVQNYYLYQGFLAAALAAFLIVPVGTCGLTLPLCFHLLKDDRRTLGHRTGLLYGANTAGSVLGALGGGYLLFYVADIDDIFKLVVAAAAAACALSAWLYARERPGRLRLLAGLGIAAAALIAALSAPPYDKDIFMQPFRERGPGPASYEGLAAFRRNLSKKTKHIFDADGPNTSVGVGANRDKNGRETARAILVNGKSDGNTWGDRFTTMMLGHLPALLSADPARVCVIGFGTGITAGVLAQYDEVRSVEIIEISPVVLRIAGMFDAYNGGVSKHRKVAFHEMDAFRFLMSAGRRFDVIISEPSNPWVQGVENLYSEEFYRIARGKLAPDGLFVQWIHVYSFTEDLFRTVMRTMGGEFPYVTVFQLGKGDRAIIGHLRPFDRADLERAAARMRRSPQVAAALKKAGLTNFHAVAALEVTPPRLAFILGRNARPQRLELPYLSRRAAVAFFAEKHADLDTLRRSRPAFFSSVDESMLGRFTRAHPLAPEDLDRLRKSFCEHETSALGRFCTEAVLMTVAAGAKDRLSREELARVPRQKLESARLFSAPAAAGRNTKAQLKDIDEMLRLVALHYSPLARFPIARLERRIDGCVRAAPAAAPRRGECLVRSLVLSRMLDEPEPAFARRFQPFAAWLSRMPAGTPDYAKFKRIQEDPSGNRLKRYFKEIFQAKPAPEE